MAFGGEDFELGDGPWRDVFVTVDVDDAVDLGRVVFGAEGDGSTFTLRFGRGEAVFNVVARGLS